MSLNLTRRSTKGSRLTAADYDTNLDKIEQAIEEIEQQSGPPGADGSDGREIELKTTSTHVQWRYVGDAAWTNLIALSAIAGPQGNQGPIGENGKNIQLQAGATHIQWRYVGDAAWTNLIALSAITGPPGAPAPAPTVLRFTLGVTGRALVPGQLSEVVVPAPGVQLSDFVDRASYSAPMPTAIQTTYECRDDQVLVLFRNSSDAAVTIPAGAIIVEVVENTGPIPEPDPDGDPDGERPDPDPEEPEPEEPEPEEPEPEIDSSVLEPFTTQQSANNNGWTAVGNSSNGHSFGWQNSTVISGASAGTDGAAGGVFARSTAVAYYADTNISAAARTNTLRIAGSLRLANVNADGVFYLGYFNSATLVSGQSPLPFVGIEFAEPSGASTGPFRAYVRVYGEGGNSSQVINIVQNTTLTFDLLWVGTSDGSGTFTGTLAGETVNVQVGPGTATLTAFGILAGGTGTSGINAKTGTCLFDNLLYRHGPPVFIEPEPDPEPTPPVVNTLSVVQWGDSMTAELGSPRIATALGGGRRVVNRGVSGQTSAEIAGRQGGFTVNCQVSGGQIPASGAVALDVLFPTIVRSVAAGVPGTLAGVPGTLRPVGTASSPTGYEFVRATAGVAVSATGNQVFTPTVTDVVDGTTFDLNSYNAVFWLGRNGVNGGPGQTDVTVYQGMIDRIPVAGQRIIILPVFNGGYASEYQGQSGYTSIMNRNAATAAAFPQFWYDIRRAFIDGAKAWMQANRPAAYDSDWSQAFKSGASIRADAALGDNSDWDVANDVPPRALRRDRIHLNSHGNDFLAELIAARLNQLSNITVLRVSDAVKPGELVTVYGEGLTAGGTQVVVDAATASTPTGSSRSLQVVNGDIEGHFVTAVLDSTLAANAFKLWARNSSGLSNAVVLNGARPQWLSIDRIAPDLTVKVVGKNLDGLEFGAIRDTRVKLINGGSEFNATVQSVNPYCVAFTVAGSVPVATYDVLVSSNGGTTWVALESDQRLAVVAAVTDPLGLGVFWARDFNWNREFSAADYPSVQAAADALKAAGGGTLLLPNGTYDFASLRLASKIVLKGQSKAGVILRVFNVAAGANWITTKDDGNTIGLVGICNLTIQVRTAGWTARFPDHFIQLGSRRVAEKIFVKDVDFDVPTTALAGGRGRAMLIQGRRYGLIDNVTVNGFKAYTLNWIDQYMEIKNCDFTAAESGLIGNVKNMYTLVENNKIEFTAALNDSVVKRGYELTSHSYVANNIVDRCSGVQNWNEQILFEPREGITKMYGSVTSATSTTITINPRIKDGVLYGHNGNNNWNLTTDYPTGWSLTIIRGKGMGQYRKITAINQSTKVVTVDKAWGVIPDSSSRFVISVLAANNVVYKNRMFNGSKPVLFYHNGVDTVYADNYSEDTQGYSFQSYYVQGTTETEPNFVAATRFSIQYFNRMVENVSKGVAEVRRASGVGYNHFLQLTSAKDEDGFAYNCYGMEIKNNYIRSVLPAPTNTNSRETPPINGIWLGTERQNGSTARRVIKGCLIEKNIIRDCNRGISLGGTLYPVWPSGATVNPLYTNPAMSYGITCRGNRFMNVTEQFVDNTGDTTVKIDNTTLTDAAAPVTTASVAGGTVTLAATDSGSGVKLTEYSLDGGATWIEYKVPFTLTTPGSYSIRYRSVDRVENVETFKTVSVTV